MDEYHCNAYPNNAAFAAEFVSDDNTSHPDDQYFNVEIEHTDMYVLNANMYHTHNDSTIHSFRNTPKDKIMQETTIVGWLCCIGVPKDAHKLLVAKIMDCARDMAHRTHKDRRVLYMHVDVTITRASEDDDDDGDDGGGSGDRFEEEAGEEEPVEEEEEGGDDHGLEPAAKSSIERLEIVKVEEEEEQVSVLKGRCAICFEDLIVGVRMPCLHLFHRNCIVDWLQIGHSCPLCRFQLPTNTSE